VPRNSHGVVNIDCGHRAIDVLPAEDVPFRTMTWLSSGAGQHGLR
jgi:hypothetical protein